MLKSVPKALALVFSLLFVLLSFSLNIESASASSEQFTVNSLQMAQLTESGRVRRAKRPSRERPLAFSQLRTNTLSPSSRIALKPKSRVRKPQKAQYREGLRRDVVIVKFVDGAGVLE